MIKFYGEGADRESICRWCQIPPDTTHMVQAAMTLDRIRRERAHSHSLETRMRMWIQHRRDCNDDSARERPTNESSPADSDEESPTLCCRCGRPVDVKAGEQAVKCRVCGRDMHLDRCAANQDRNCERPQGWMTVQDVYRIDSEKYEQAIRRHLENETATSEAIRTDAAGDAMEVEAP